MSSAPHMAFVAALLLVATVSAGTLFGTYTPSKYTFNAMNKWLSVNQSVELINIGFNHKNTVKKAVTALTHSWERGAVPVLTWMPYPYKTWLHPSPNEDIVKGVYDDYIEAFLDEVQAFLAGGDGKIGSSDDRRLFLRFAPEANGDWFPWSPECPPCGTTGQKINQTAASYITMWKYVMQKVRVKFSFTPDLVQIVFAVNNVDAVNVNYKMEDFYPGEYVDWFAMDGYNWGTAVPGNKWESAKDLFEPMFARLSKLNSTIPQSIQTISSTTTPNGQKAKGAWLEDAMQYASAQKAMKMLVLYNADSQTDFSLFGGNNGLQEWFDKANNFQYNEYPQIKAQAQNATNAFIFSNSSLVRIITDAAFYGQ